MAIKIVTSKKGEPHVTSADAGALNQGTFGTDDYVLNVGEKFRAELVSNNEIKIYDGEGMMQGRYWRIEPGTYESVTIDNGSQGKKRKDLIVARYTKDSETGVENVELAVLKGSETEGNATAPEATKGDIRNGDLKHEMVLYTVTLAGLNVTAVDTGWKMLGRMADLQHVNERKVTRNAEEIVEVVDLCGGRIHTFRAERQGKIAHLYIQTENMSQSPANRTVFKIKDSKFFPAEYGVYPAMVLNAGRQAYSGLFQNGDISAEIYGGVPVSASAKASLIFSMTYICAG